MKVIKVECPNCGATDILNEVDGSLPARCPYCDVPIMIDEGTKTIVNNFYSKDEEEDEEEEYEEDGVEEDGFQTYKTAGSGQYNSTYSGFAGFRNDYQDSPESSEEERKKWKRLCLILIAVSVVLIASSRLSALGFIVLVAGGIVLYQKRPQDAGNIGRRQVVYQRVEYASPKSRVVALILCILLGPLGAHHFYAGRFGMGILYLFTGGIFFIGWIVDIIKIAAGTFRDSNGLRMIE